MSTSPFKNSIGLQPSTLSSLVERIRTARDFGAELQNRILGYLVDGEGESVLGDIGGNPKSAEILELQCGREHGFHVGPWKSFLATIEPVDCRFYLRLAKVFEAAARRAPANRFFCQSWFDNVLWLEVILQEATQSCANSWHHNREKIGLSGPLLESMLAADGISADALVTAPFRAPPGWNTSQMREMVLLIADLGTTYAAHRELLIPFLKEGSAESRRIAVENLVRAEAPLEAFSEEVAVAAVDSSKLLREAAEGYMATSPQAARGPLERLAREGTRNQKIQAIRLLARFCRDSARPLLEELLAGKPSQPIVEAIQSAISELAAAVSTAESLLEPPPQTPLPLNPPVTPAVRECLRDIFAEYNQLVTHHNALFQQKTNQSQYIYPNQLLSPLAEDQLDPLCGFLERGGPRPKTFADTLAHGRFGSDKGAFKAFLEHPETELLHVVRLLRGMGSILTPSRQSSGMNYGTVAYLEAFRRTHAPRYSLMDLAAAIRALDLPDEILLQESLDGYYRVFDWEPEAVWPFFAAKLDVLEAAFDPVPDKGWPSKWQRDRRLSNVVRILVKFPAVPPRLVGKLWEMALGTNKSERLPAQMVAAKLPDLQARLAQALTSGNSQTRSVAAEWLGRLGDKRAIPALDAAARKEKQDAALDEILTALEKLGQPIEPYLDREKLTMDAAKGLKKGIPEVLSFFPWDRLPQVHWQDNGTEVSKDVLTWLVVQNYKLKSAEAGPLLRRYCEMIRPADREELGRFVLGAWLDQDLKRKLSDAEARAEAKKRAPQAYQSYQQQLQWYQTQKQYTPPAVLSYSLPQVEESIFQDLQREVGSAAGEKGILAVAGACCGDSAVAPVARYLKEWYGYRAAQCKALIAMLSTIDRPSAIQYLLSISNRFRTKGIREEAEKYVQILADRKGWTLNELADRTMPTAGLDEEGKLELSFGTRKFVARVNAELEAVLYDEEGKALKALPAPRKEDDEELAKAAKKTFSAAKAELKKFASLQETRLYEAMCTERTWPAVDWKTYLLSHPLFKFLCQRVVWSIYDGEKLLGTFRPLDDGTFTDFDDKTVNIPDKASLRIAHGCHLPAEVAAAWTRHLADYDVSPMFTQFGREAYELPESKRTETKIADFEGHMLEAFKLRGLATKLGYTRGQAQDGGWFYDYHKSFPGLGLKAILTFSGNGLPEENRNVALVSLEFQKASAEQDAFLPQAGVPLSELPAVLLTECYNDLRSLAAAGTGHDPEWQKKVY